MPKCTMVIIDDRENGRPYGMRYSWKSCPTCLYPFQNLIQYSAIFVNTPEIF